MGIVVLGLYLGGVFGETDPRKIQLKAPAIGRLAIRLRLDTAYKEWMQSQVKKETDLRQRVATHIGVDLKEVAVLHTSEGSVVIDLEMP